MELVQTGVFMPPGARFFMYRKVKYDTPTAATPAQSAIARLVSMGVTMVMTNSDRFHCLVSIIIILRPMGSYYLSFSY